MKIVEYTKPLLDKPKAMSDIISYGNELYERDYLPSEIADAARMAAASMTAWALTFNNDGLVTRTSLDALLKAFETSIIEYVVMNDPMKLSKGLVQ